MFPRSLAARLIALYAALFVASIAALAGVVWLAAEKQISSQIAESVKREATTLADESRAVDPDTAAILVERRLRRGRSSFYLLQNAFGNPIAGNIEPVVPFSGPFESRIELATPRGSVRAMPELRKVIGYGVTLPNGALAVAADGVERVEDAKHAILLAFLSAGAISLLLAVAGGLLISRGFLRRIEAINRTAGEIMAGRLDARVPARADGDEIDALAVKINDMLDQTYTLMDNLRQVSSDVAHDLRTPLARLRQQLECAREEARGEAQFRAAIDAALAEADGLLGTFSALLRISQIESGARRAAFARLDLSATMRMAADTYAPIAEDEDRALRSDIAPGVEIMGDRDLLMQVFANLIENAIRHTPKGARIALTLAREGEGVVASVADDGPGVPEAERENVLRRFYRLERSRNTAGNGLGLSLVAATAELHGARLALEDARPGLRVTLRFPAVCAAEPPPQFTKL